MLRIVSLLFTFVLVSLFAPAAWSQDLLRESPVPVTVITDTMIKDIGALNLKDVLVTYVPGITFSQDHNEVNVAMRGVYASSQQKILILLDGHVLNSRAYASGIPDFAISLDKIKRIEVLRGAASSLYGNGALTAVVSIFTQTADDANETMISVGAGNFGQVKLSGLFGGKTDKGGLLAWATVYQSDGQTVDIPASQDISRNPSNSHAILGGFRGPASHDVGLSLKTAKFTLQAAHRLGKYIEPLSAAGATGESYNYADYQTDHGVGPGLAMESINFDLSHERKVSGNTSLLVRGYFDRNDLAAHFVSDPSQRAHASARFSEWDYGMIAQFSGSYPAKGRQGQWLVGGQADLMRVFDSVLVSGAGGGWTTVGRSGGLLDLGSEQIYSGFADIKQPLGNKVIANAGIRFDQKVRREGDNINTVSPRVSLIFLPDERASVAVSYSESFVDAPYWYRYNSLPSYRGSRNLKPEYEKSFQITPTVTISKSVNTKWNLFYNDLDNLLWRNKNAGPADPIYQNAGFLKSWGIEHEVSYAREWFNLNGNVTYQRASSFQNYDVTGAKVHNVPNWTWNAIFNVRPPAVEDLWFNVTARYIGPQLSPVNVTIGSTTFAEPNRSVDGAFLMNAGVRMESIGSTNLFLDARIYNLLDEKYEQGGSVSHPYPQQGRGVMFSLGYRL